MPPVGDPYLESTSGGRTAQIGPTRATRVRVTRAANDNHSIHATWRRMVAVSMAALFAASLILVGLVCIGRADIIGN
jgi:hypothetical protein